MRIHPGHGGRRHRVSAPPLQPPGVQVDVLLPDEDEAPAIVRLRGELDLAHIRTVEDELAPIVGRADRDVIIDLADLGFIDVSGVNLLVRTAGELTEADRVLQLRSPSPMLLRVLHLTGLDQHLPIVAPKEARA